MVKVLAAHSQEGRPVKTAVLVLGMHRSGTSSLAGLLDGLGCTGPKTLMPASMSNPKGYYESLPLCQLNDEILAALGSRWYDWSLLSVDWARSPELAAFQDRALEAISSEFGTAPLIYLKDPRFCLLLPFWQRVVTKMGYRCIHLHTHRHPMDVAASLYKRDGFDPASVLPVWLSHILQAERHSRQHQRFFTSYDRLLKDPSAVAVGIEAAFDLQFPTQSGSAWDRIDPALRHHDSRLDPVLKDDKSSGLIRETLAILETWIEQGEDRSDYPHLDRIASEFMQADRLFGAPLRASQLQASGISPRLVHKNSLNQTIKDKEMLDQQRNQILEGRDTERQLRMKLQDKLAQAETTIKDLSLRLLAAENKASALSKTFAEAEANQARQEEELSLLTDRLIDRDRAMAAIRGDILASSVRLAEKDRQIVKIKKTAQQQVKKLEHEFITSTSWRFSKPLRFAGRILRRLTLPKIW